MAIGNNNKIYWANIPTFIGGSGIIPSGFNFHFDVPIKLPPKKQILENERNKKWII